MPRREKKLGKRKRGKALLHKASDHVLKNLTASTMGSYCAAAWANQKKEETSVSDLKAYNRQDGEERVHGC